MKTASVLMFAASCALVLVGCGAGQGDSSETTAAAGEALASTPNGQNGYTSVHDCTLEAGLPYGWASQRGAAQGSFECPNSEAEQEVEICVEQLVTGGWQTISCRTNTLYNTAAGPGAIAVFDSSFVSGRWYRSWAWGYVKGHSGAQYSGAVYSGACKGSGGTGCF